MSELLPVQWNETLGRIKDNAVNFLNKLKQSKSRTNLSENMTEDLLPSFMQFSGPVLDMHELADELIITAEVPGLAKDDFTVELIGDRVVIRGEKKVSRKLKQSEGSYLSECSYGAFSRSLQLPYDVKEGVIKADLKNGILTILMPKSDSESKRQRRITIT